MAVSEVAADLFGLTKRQVDRLVPVETREKAYAQTKDFALARPLLFSFILSLTAFTLIPLLLFICFTGSTFLFAAGAALVFSLFWTGVALAILVPTLFITGAIAFCVWAWAIVSFLAVRWAFGVLQGLAVDHAPKRQSQSSLSPVLTIPSPSSWTKIGPDDQIKGRDEKRGGEASAEAGTPPHKHGFAYESVTAS